MAGVVFVISSDLHEHWQRALDAGFWESTDEIDVEVGDPLVFWLAGGGLLGVAEATRPTAPVDYGVAPRPWLERDRRQYTHRYAFSLLESDITEGPRWSRLVELLGRAGTVAHLRPVRFERSVGEVIAALRLRDQPPGTTGVELEPAGWNSHQPSESGGMLGEYNEPDEDVQSKPSPVFQRDPRKVDRGLRGHRFTQNGLASWLRDHDIEPQGPGSVNVDLAWVVDGLQYVAEVKSLNLENERNQIRLGMGEVIDFAYRLGGARCVLAVEKSPRDPDWVPICAGVGVQLVWPATFDRLGAWMASVRLNQ